MRSTYSRGNVSLSVDQPIGSDQVTFTITREAPLSDDEVRRVNAELCDYPAARGAQLIRSPQTGEWHIRADTVLAGDHGDPTAELRWEATA